MSLTATFNRLIPFLGKRETDKQLEHNKSNTVEFGKQPRMCYITEIACPFDRRERES